MTIVTRAKNIMLQPQTEWEIVFRESATTRGLYLGYILPLAAIGPVATFVGISMIGFGPFRMPLQFGLTAAVVAFAMALCSVFIVALVIDGLAATFYGRKNRQQALKLAAYSFTPSWLGGILMLFPVLGPLTLLAGLYAIYLLYVGLPVLMESPKEKAAPYTASVVVAAIVIQLVLGSVAGVMTGATGGVNQMTATLPEPPLTLLSAEQQKSLDKLNEVTMKMQVEQQKQQDDPDQNNE